MQNYFNFENSSFVVHVTRDQTGVLFLGHPVEVFSISAISQIALMLVLSKESSDIYVLVYD